MIKSNIATRRRKSYKKLTAISSRKTPDNSVAVIKYQTLPKSNQYSELFLGAISAFTVNLREENTDTVCPSSFDPFYIVPYYI